MLFIVFCLQFESVPHFTVDGPTIFTFSLLSLLRADCSDNMLGLTQCGCLVILRVWHLIYFPQDGVSCLSCSSGWWMPCYLNACHPECRMEFKLWSFCWSKGCMDRVEKMKTMFVILSRVTDWHTPVIILAWNQIIWLSNGMSHTH